MSSTASRRDACCLCGGTDLEQVLQLEDSPVADAYLPAERLHEKQETYPLDLALCKGCGHVQLLHVVDPEILFRNYTYVSSVSLGLVEHFRSYADQVLDRIQPSRGSLVVDIGSNDGSLLRFFQERSMRVLGVDPAREIARDATDSGIETLPSFFTAALAAEIRDDRGPAKIVSANNVFAHAADLADITEGIRSLLTPDGVFVFEVSYLLDVIEKSLFDTIYHEHLCYHSVKPLQAFFRLHGMELIDVERVSPKLGSLRGTVQLKGGPRGTSPSVARLIDLETTRGLHRAETLRAFAAHIERVKAQIGELLSKLRTQGMTIAGYGASSTVTTLVYHFGLGDALSFIADDNPLKQGMFTPGKHIPVLPSEAIYERNPDHVIILAWNYAQTIMAKHKAFVERGGHFVVPLPTVSVHPPDS